MTKHSTTINSPLQWYDALADTIRKAECRIKGQNSPLGEAIAQIADLFTQARQKNACVYWVGNGGSAAMCSHLSQDLMNKFEVRSQTFADASLMTCMANDFGYDQVYSRVLEKMAVSGDVLIAISSSGNSENILNSVQVAQNKGMKIITLSGMKSDNRLWNIDSDVSFLVLSDLYGIVEVAHEAIVHGIIETMWLKKKNI